ncbi:MAG: tail fiber protein [Patulibacter minatonensis]
MSDTYLGEIRLFANDYAPRGWAICAGQVMQISQNSALFAILGTIYGGNGTTTFQLPNLQGNLAVGAGSGRGLTPYAIGEAFGTTSVTLTPDQMPKHSHAIVSGATPASGTSPRGAILTRSAGGTAYSTVTTPLVPMADQAVTRAGSGAAHRNVQPYVAMNYCIALQGAFPTFG